MNGFLLDTKVISELIKPQPDRMSSAGLPKRTRRYSFSAYSLSGKSDTASRSSTQVSGGSTGVVACSGLASPLSGPDLDHRRRDCATMGCAVGYAANVSGTGVPLLDPWQQTAAMAQIWRGSPRLRLIPPHKSACGRQTLRKWQMERTAATPRPSA